MIRKAKIEDINDVVSIYDDVHSREESGEVTTGWLRDIYPTGETAKTSLARGDLFVQSDEAGEIIGTAIINKQQVDCYVNGNWKYDADDDEIMVIHTLVIKGDSAGQGRGSEFLNYYETYAKDNGCRYLRLDTNARNMAARSFYKRHGYWEVGTTPTVFNGIPGVDLVLIEKAL